MSFLDRTLVAALALMLLAVGLAATPAPAASAAYTPEDCVPRHVDGLGRACVRADGLFEVLLPDGLRLLTHGPDPIPSDRDEDVLPDAVGDPACGTEYVQHILYGHASNRPNRHASVRGTIQGHVRAMNMALSQDSLASGGIPSDYRVLCNDDGTIAVGQFSAPANAVEFGDIVAAARAAGFTDAKRDYSIFWDGSHSAYCGVANFHDDDSAGVNNANNHGGDYAVTYVGCWAGRTPMHENGHNQGAVQRLAPDSDLAGHCLEGRDVMCYPTSSVLVLCPSRIFFDCDYDSYYDAVPEPGEWLSNHWNIGSPANRFILHGGVRRPEAPVLSGVAGDTTASLSWTVPSDNGAFLTAYKVFRDGALRATLAPSATTFADAGLTNGVAYSYTVKATNNRGDSAASNALVVTPRSGNLPPTACFAESLEWLTATVSAACASDADGTLLSFAWQWGDGTPGASGASASHLFEQPGSYLVTLTVMDDNGATASTSKWLTATLPPDPDPAVPTLANGQAGSATVGAMGGEAFFKVFVPAGRPHLRVHLDGPNCTQAMAVTLLCNPNLDLYVRPDARPTDTAYACRSNEIDSDEVCMPIAPQSGWWFVRVKYVAGTGPAPFTVTASH